MSSSNATLVMIGLFALRCLVPVALTILFGMWMNRLVARWEAEDQAAAQAPATPAMPAPAPTRTQAVACWLLNNCSEQDCPAYKQTGVLCWQVRLQAEKVLPARCHDCEIYARTAPAI